MARTIAEIKKEMTTRFLNEPEIISRYGINPSRTFEEQFSKVSIESIWFYTVAFAVWVLENLFDLHKIEVSKYIDTMKPHSLEWYAEKAKQYQHGFSLIEGTDQFDNTGKTDREIAESKVVAYASVVERDKQIMIKVAKLAVDGLVPLSSEELAGLREYMEQVKDAGVELNIISLPAEDLKLDVKIYYDPLILDSEGKRLDGTNDTPVLDAVRNYLNNIGFDGTVVLAHLTDELQRVGGVYIPQVDHAYFFHSGSIDWEEFFVTHRPSSGYMTLKESGLIATYISKLNLDTNNS